MSDQLAPGAAVGLVLAGGEEDVVADGEGARVEGLGGRGGFAAVVHAYAAEVAAEAILHEAAGRPVEAVARARLHPRDGLGDAAGRRAAGIADALALRLGLRLLLLDLRRRLGRLSLHLLLLI